MLPPLKRAIKGIFPGVQRKWVGNDISHLIRPSYDMVIEQILKAYPESTFVVIGANDGVSNDPLFKWINGANLKGLLVEPLPDVFEKLKATHAANKNVRFANYAITPDAQTLPFYRLRKDYGKHARFELKKACFDDRLSSFSIPCILKHVGYDGPWEDIIEKIDIPCTTFDALCREFAIPQVDILQIDAEGFDSKILLSIDLGKYAPKLICYEHVNLDEKSHTAALEYVVKQDYFWTQDRYNVIAVRREIAEAWQSEYAAQECA
jgi:FkbM family methyltransferase